MGTYQAFLADANKPTGAVYEAGSYSKKHQGTNAGTDIIIGIDVSRSNPVYGNSDMVTPISQSTLYILKY